LTHARRYAALVGLNRDAARWRRGLRLDILRWRFDARDAVRRAALDLAVEGGAEPVDARGSLAPAVSW